MHHLCLPFSQVENSLRGASFPIIIADSTVCQELRLLEPEINGTSDVCNGREESLHFLDELGWLFGRKYNSCLFQHPDYRLYRFKFLLVFSVERDFCALVKSLLDILLELNSGRNGLEEESLELLSEIHLLNRAVKRRCASMVDFLIHYTVVDSSGTSKRFIFYPNMAGPGGLTPLHLAASLSSSDDIVDLLTSDPHEVLFYFSLMSRIFKPTNLTKCVTAKLCRLGCIVGILFLMQMGFLLMHMLR